MHKVAQHPLSQPKRVIGGGPAAKDELGITEPKGIRHDNTRIVNQEDLEEAARQAGVPSSPSHSNIAAAISGTPCRLMLVAQMRSKGAGETLAF